MLHAIIALCILTFLIILFIGFTWFKKLTEGFQNAASNDLSGSTSIYPDTNNPGLTRDQLYGQIAKNTSIAIFSFAELLASIDNPVSSDGANKTGSGAGMYLNITDIPEQTPPSNDIEALLNALEGFEDGNGGYTDTQRATAGATTGGISAAMNFGPYLLPAISKKLKNINLIKSAILQAGKAAAKVGAAAGLGAAKSASRLLAAKIASKIAERIGKIIAAVTGRAAVMIAAANTAFAAAAAMAATVVGLIPAIPVIGAAGVLMILATTSVAITTAMAVKFPDGGVCDDGWKRVSDEWPAYIDVIISLIPGVGDLFSPVAPYMCYNNSCEGKDEMAGLCYTPCDFGYNGLFTMCIAKYETIGVGVLKDCPPGWNNDGLICREPIELDGCPGGSHDVWGTCWKDGFPTWITRQLHERNMRGGNEIGRMNNDSRLRCPSDHPDEIDGLCYRACPRIGVDKITTTVTPYPIYIRKLTSTKQDAAKLALNNALADPKSSEKLIADLQTDLSTALLADLALGSNPNAPYVRNTVGPRLIGEPPVEPPIPRRWPAIEPPAYTNLLAGIKNNRVVFYTPILGWVPFETIFGSYGHTLDTDGQIPVRISMSEIGPQILTQSQRLYRWNISKMDWEWNGGGLFKELAAANNSFTYGIGTDNEPYYYRWADNKRGLGTALGKVGSGWSWLTAGIAANNWPINSGYDTIMTTRDHGNMFSTNSLAEGHIAINWDYRYLWNASEMFGGISAMTPGKKPTCVAMTPKFNASYYFGTDEGYIFKFTGKIDTRLPNNPGVDPRGDPTRTWIPGPTGAGAIKSMTVDTNDILYVICANGKLYRQPPSPNLAPSTNIQVPSGFPVYDQCATSITGIGGNKICFAGFKQTMISAPNPDYDNQKKVFDQAQGATGWVEILELDGTSSAVTSISICASLTNDQYAAHDTYMKYYTTMMSTSIINSNQPLFTKDASGNYTVPFAIKDGKYSIPFNDTTGSIINIFPVPPPTVDPANIPTILQSVTIDPSQLLEHCKGAPYQCIGKRGLTYDRGIGTPKLQIKMVSPTPADPIPPQPWFSSYCASDTPLYTADFSSPLLLNEMCYFYYKSALENLIESTDNTTLSFNYITSITSVIASSERSADIMCDMTTIVVDPVANKITSQTLVPGADRRFYFTVIKKTGSFVVTGCTNFNLSTSGIFTKDASGNILTDTSGNNIINTDAKTLNTPAKAAVAATSTTAAIPAVPAISLLKFTPNSCPQVPITIGQCMAYVPRMVSLFNSSDTTRRISVLYGIDLSGDNTCLLDWQDNSFSVDDNAFVGGVGNRHTARFRFVPSSSNIACLYTISSFKQSDILPTCTNKLDTTESSSTLPTRKCDVGKYTVTQFPTPKVYPIPSLPAVKRVTVSGAANTCVAQTDTSAWPHKLVKSTTQCAPPVAKAPAKSPEIYIPKRYSWAALF